MYKELLNNLKVPEIKKIIKVYNLHTKIIMTKKTKAKLIDELMKHTKLDDKKRIVLKKSLVSKEFKRKQTKEEKQIKPIEEEKQIKPIEEKKQKKLLMPNMATPVIITIPKNMEISNEIIKEVKDSKKNLIKQIKSVEEFKRELIERMKTDDSEILTNYLKVAEQSIKKLYKAYEEIKQIEERKEKQDKL